MEKAKLAGSRLCGDRCGNGCCVSRRMRSDCSTNSRHLIGPRESNCFSVTGLVEAKARKSRHLIGPRESNCFSVTGLVEAKARKSILRSTRPAKKFACSQRVQTR